MFAIEMLPANHGDGLWLEYGTPPDTHHVLIDGGPPYAREAIGGRVARAGGHLELLVVSHVDFDHIGGVVALLAHMPDGVRIDDVWFNGYHQLPGGPDDALGAVQGEMTSAAIQARKLPWNKAFGGNAVTVGDGDAAPVPLTLPGGLKLTVLGPTTTALAALRPKWQAEVEDQNMIPGKFEDGLEKLRERERLPDDVLGEEAPDLERLDAKPFKEDESLPNWSSIALLAEYEDRRLLLAADAPPGVLLPAVEALCAARGEQRLRLDAVKLAHHGSKGSTSAELLDRLDCQRFLISTNGKIYGHPSPETLARTILHSKASPTLYFNYHTPHSTSFVDRQLQRKWGYQTMFPEADGGLRLEL